LLVEETNGSVHDRHEVRSTKAVAVISLQEKDYGLMIQTAELGFQSESAENKSHQPRTVMDGIVELDDQSQGYLK
jgi:hypothetical protein